MRIPGEGGCYQYIYFYDFLKNWGREARGGGSKEGNIIIKVICGKSREQLCCLIKAKCFKMHHVHDVVLERICSLAHIINL